MNQEDTNVTSVSPSENNNPPEQYNFVSLIKTYANIQEELQHQSELMYANEPMYANEAAMERTNTDEEQQYANIGSDGNVIETDPGDGVQIYAEVNKPHKTGPILAKPVDNEGEYAEYGPAPTVPDKKY